MQPFFGVPSGPQRDAAGRRRRGGDDAEVGAVAAPRDVGEGDLREPFCVFYFSFCFFFPRESDERSQSIGVFTLENANMKKGYFKLHQPDYGPT